MPAIDVNGVRLAYRESGNRNGAPLVFTHSLLWDSEMFDDLIALLSDQFHIINIDQHGHGLSSTRAELTLAAMADDYAALLQQLDLGAVHWAGLSMGGMVGMRLALGYPQAIRSLVLMDTSARPERPEQRELSMQSIEVMRAHGTAAVSDAVLQLFFAPHSYRTRPQLVEHYRKKFEAYQHIDNILIACRAVFDRDDISDKLKKITLPALVIVGEDDAATLPEESEFIAAQLPQAKLVVIKEAAHMSATEKPGEVAAAMREFLLQH